MTLAGLGSRFKRPKTPREAREMQKAMEPVAMNDGRPVITEGLKDFIRRVFPRYRFTPYIDLVIAELERGYVHGGELWINLPPRLGKTKLMELFSAWAISQDGLLDVAYVSYGQNLVNESCKEGRDYFLEAGGKLDPSMRMKSQWETIPGGGMWGAGMNGRVRGKGYHIGIIDDIHKDTMELYSEAKVLRVKTFMESTWPNRAHIHTHRPILRIYVGQRLGENDVFGYLKERIDAKSRGADWRCVILEGKKTDDSWEAFIPAGAHLVMDERPAGAMLDPERMDANYFTENFPAEDDRLAQCQQRPRAVSGAILQRVWFKVISPQQVPALSRRVAGGDLAISTKESADFTVFFPLGTNGRNYYLFRPYREKRESPDLRREVPVFLRRHRVSMVAVESNQFQLAFVQELRADPTMAGIVVKKVVADKDKQSRARAWAPFAEQGLVYLVEDGSGWTDVFLDEIGAFPRGRHDDQVDGVGHAFVALREFQPGGAATTGGKRPV